MVQITNGIFKINHPEEDSLKISIKLGDAQARATRSTGAIQKAQNGAAPKIKMRHHRKQMEEDDAEEQKQVGTYEN